MLTTRRIPTLYSMKLFDFFQETQFGEIIKRVGVVIGGAALAIFFIHGLWQLYDTARILQRERAEKEAELSALVKERERLEAEIAYLKSASALEREAKSRLNYKRAGEEVVIVAPEERQTATSSVAAPKQSLWARILDWFLSQ